MDSEDIFLECLLQRGNNSKRERTGRVEERIAEAHVGSEWVVTVGGRLACESS